MPEKSAGWSGGTVLDCYLTLHCTETNPLTHTKRTQIGNKRNTCSSTVEMFICRTHCIDKLQF